MVSKLRTGLDAVAAEVDRLVLDPRSFTQTTLDAPGRELVAPRRILVGVDGSAPSRRAVDWAVVLAREYDAEVEVATVVAPGAEFLIYQDRGKLEKSELDAGREALASASARVLRAGFDARSHLLRGDPAQELSKFAKENKVDLIVVGDRGRGRIAKVLLGSVARKVMNLAPSDVLVVKNAPPPSRVLVAIDGSPESKRAVGIAARIADDWAAASSVLLVIPPPGFAGLRDARYAYHRRFDPLNLPRLHKPPIQFEVEFGRPADVILARARQRQSNLILQGSRGLGRMERTVLGSVSTRVANEAEASVWIVRDAREA